MQIFAKGLCLIAAAALLGAATPAPRAPAPRAPAPAAAEPAGARTFVRAIYAHYPAPENGPYLHWEGRDGERYLDASLLALYRQAYGAAQNEVISGMDADYFCQCQDDAEIRWAVTSIRAVDATRAAAVVTVRFGSDRASTNRVTLDLVRTAQGWRVHDVRSGDSSWRADLAQGIREAHAAH